MRYHMEVWTSSVWNRTRNKKDEFTVSMKVVVIGSEHYKTYRHCSFPNHLFCFLQFRRWLWVCNSRRHYTRVCLNLLVNIILEIESKPLGISEKQLTVKHFTCLNIPCSLKKYILSHIFLKGRTVLCGWFLIFSV